jgi:hypothetical protein
MSGLSLAEPVGIRSTRAEPQRLAPPRLELDRLL